MIKIQIKNRCGVILFEHEKENNTIKDTVLAAIKKGANLRDANLRGVDLSGVDLSVIKKDMFDVLLRAIPEIPNLKKSIIEGKIDGSTYDGDCCCLCGTLEKSDNVIICERIKIGRDASRPIERFFCGINPGDTPETNQFSKLALEWVEEFESYIKQ